MECKNCNKEINSKFCPDCGQETTLKRIDGKYIIHEIEHVLHLERGILYTIRELTTNPGQNIRKYLSENRSLLVKPIIFIVITSLIYTLSSRFFHTEVYFKFAGLENSTIGKILGWIQANYGYANILYGVFIAILLKIFFKKYGYNFYEILVMLCYTIGMSMVLYTVFAIIEGILHLKLIKIEGIISLLYIVWASSNFFEENKVVNYLKSLLSFVLGTAVFYIIIFAVGQTIDVLTKF